MLALLSGFFQTIFGWLGQLLPDSPFESAFHVAESWGLGLGWLNWFIPIDAMLLVLAGWIAAGVAITAARVVISKGLSIGTKLIP